MKTSRIAAAAILVTGLLCAAVHADEELVLYDNFNKEFIDATKWFVFSGQDDGINVLDLSRTIDKGRLHMIKRTYGRSSDGGAAGESSNLVIPIPIGFNVTAIEATVQVNDIEAIGCEGNPIPTSAYPRLQGYFFNSEPPPLPPTPPPPIGATNEVMAQIGIYEDSLSASDADWKTHHHKCKMLDVVASVIHCVNQTCSPASTIIGKATLETISLGEKRRLGILWDKQAGSFIFTSSTPHSRRQAKSAEIFYSGLSVYPSTSNAHKRLSISHVIPNCPIVPDEPRPVAYTDVYFENVYVNESAPP